MAYSDATLPVLLAQAIEPAYVAPPCKGVAWRAPAAWIECGSDPLQSPFMDWGSMTANDHDQERREIIRRLAQEETRLHAKTHSLEAEKQRLYFELADLHRAQGRAAGPLPAGDVCPTCWINHGEQVQMRIAEPSGRSAPDGAACPKCGREEPQELSPDIRKLAHG